MKTIYLYKSGIIFGWINKYFTVRSLGLDQVTWNNRLNMRKVYQYRSKLTKQQVEQLIRFKGFMWFWIFECCARILFVHVNLLYI